MLFYDLLCVCFCSFDDDDDAEAEPVEGEKLRSYAVLHEVIHCVPSMLREAANREVIAKKEQAQEEAATSAVTAEGKSLPF